jgi:hypothetical protein
MEVLVSHRQQDRRHGGFLLTVKRDRKAARRFLRKAVGLHGDRQVPSSVFPTRFSQFV